MNASSLPHTLAVLVCGSATFALQACSLTYHEKIAPARAAFQDGSLEEASALLEERIEETDEDDSERDFLLLERSLVAVASGHAAQAEETLRYVRDRFDDVERAGAKALAADFASYFTDDRFRDYAGEDYEKIMIRVFLTFASLLQGGEDAVAYAQQTLEKQRLIRDEEITLPDGTQERFKASYKAVGIADYLYGLVTELDPTAASEALISYRRVKELEPQFSAVDDDLRRLEGEGRRPDGEGTVYVFAMVGKGPEKREVEEHDLTFALELALQLTRWIRVIGEHFGPTLDLSPLRIPAVVGRRDQDVDAIGVLVDHAAVGTTEVVTNITRMAVEQFRALREFVVARAIVRRMAKKAVTTAAKGFARRAVRRSSDRSDRHDTYVEETLIELCGLLANTLWSASERADTRHWAFLPHTVQSLRISLPAGEHHLALSPLWRGRRSGPAQTLHVSVEAGTTGFVLGFFPSAGFAPPPVASERLRPSP